MNMSYLSCKVLCLVLLFSSNLLVAQQNIEKPYIKIDNGDLTYYTKAVFSINSQNIIAVASDNSICVFNNQGQKINVLKGHEKPIRSISVNSQSNIYSVSEDKSIRIWSPEGKLIQTIDAHSKAVTSVAVSKSGSYFVSSSEDKLCKIWDRSGKLKHILKGHTDVVNSVAISEDENFIFTASDDNSLKLWTINGEMLRTFNKFDGQIRSIQYSPDNKKILISIANEAYLLTHTGKQISVFTGHNGRVNQAVFSPDGQFVLTASNDHTAKLWNLEGTLMFTFNGHYSAVNSVAFSHNGNQIVTTSLDNTIHIYQNPTKEIFVQTNEISTYLPSNIRTGLAIANIPKKLSNEVKFMKADFPVVTPKSLQQIQQVTHSSDNQVETLKTTTDNKQLIAENAQPLQPKTDESFPKEVKRYNGPLFSVFDYETMKRETNKPKVFAVVVGIASYNHVQSLKFTKDDAYLMYAFLKSPEGGAIPDNQITLLIDGNATKDRIMQALVKTFSQAGENDAILFYYAGHGLNTGLLPIDYDGFNNILPYGDIYDVFENNHAKYKFCITDACYAGSFSQYASRDGFDEVEKVLSNYYNAINKTTGGTAILMSSKAQEKSVEYLGLRQGVFSHFLIRGLKGESDVNKDKLITILELYDYVEKQVRSYTGNNQSPSLFGNFDLNMPVAGVR